MSKFLKKNSLEKHISREANSNPSGRRKKLLVNDEEVFKSKKSISTPSVYTTSKRSNVNTSTGSTSENDRPRNTMPRELKKVKSFKEFRESGIEKKSFDSSLFKRDNVKNRSLKVNDKNENLEEGKQSRTRVSTPPAGMKEREDKLRQKEIPPLKKQPLVVPKGVRSNISGTKRGIKDSKNIGKPSYRKKPANFLFKSDDDDKRFKKYKTNKSEKERIVKRVAENAAIKGTKQITISKQESSQGKAQSGTETLIRLNRFISNAGVCSRRDADILIQDGLIKVNGKVVTELGYKVQRTDKIEYENSILNRERQVYILLNKPKDFITTMEDPDNRKTVMHLVEKACEERVYPVGRLDRNTTGLLLLTNDGNLAATLTHPKHEVKKIYQVDLDKSLTEDDFEKIVNGVELEDGLVKVDDIEIISADKKTVGIEIHEGRNRIVRRLFEHLGYEVVLLDRVMYAGLTKKDLPRGKYRMLTEKELMALKRFK